MPINSNNQMEISKSGLQSGNLLDLLKLSWAVNQQKLKDAFDKVGIEIACEKDLEFLSELNKKGFDVGGAIKDESDNPVMFDTSMILKTIEFSEDERQGKTLSKEIIFIK